MESGGTEAEQISPPPPKLPIFFTIPPPQSPEPSGMLTPPLHPSAAVPFKWEEEPGKPFPCTAIIPCPPPQPDTFNKGLGLPPRLQLMDLYTKMTKMPSPTTVLDGPYLGKTLVSTTPLSSFRFKRERQGSFGSSSTTCGSPENAMVLSKKGSDNRCFLGSWRKKTSQKYEDEEDDDDEGSLVFLPPMDMEGSGGGENEVSGCSSTRVKVSRMRRKGSSSSIYHVRSHFWANIYYGFKQVLPWKSRKQQKKDRIFV